MEIRSKLLIATVSLVMIPFVVLTVIGMNFVGDGIRGQAQTKIIADLGAVHEIYSDMEEKLALIAYFSASKEEIFHDIENSTNTNILKHIQSIKEKNPFISTIIITDSSGRVIARSNNPLQIGESLASDPFVVQALRGNETVGSVIVPEEELTLDGLEEQVRIELIPGEGSEQSETRGMMIKASSPIYVDGKVAGSMVVGHLLNRDFTIVDKARDAVKVKTATIFMDDLRISTNVKKSDGTRAIGTRVSAPVYDAVLRDGTTYYGKALVVDDWYIAAYEPIYDINGKIIGILYAGTPEYFFTELNKNTQRNFLLIGLVSLVSAIFLSLFISHKLVKPVDTMLYASEKVAKVASDLSSSIEEIDVITEQISGTTKAVSDGVSQHVLMMAEINRASKEMLEGVQKVATESQVAAENADNATKTANEVGQMSADLSCNMTKIQEALNKSAGAINGLERKSQRMGEIIGAIGNVAYQTNMLALNASIEAARAGEHGKGFAIVANEVRQLAEESKNAADQINVLLNEIQAEIKIAVENMERSGNIIGEGGAIIEKTSKGINQIIKTSGEMTIMFNEIAAASEEQSVSNEEITASVRDVAAIIEKSARATRGSYTAIEEQTVLIAQLVNSAQELTKLATGLQEEVWKFNQGKAESVKEAAPKKDQEANSL